MRVLGRLLRRARTVLGGGAQVGAEAFRTRTRSVRRVAQQLHRAARRKGEQAAEGLKQAYAKLVGIAQRSRRQAERVAAALRDQATGQGPRLVERIDHFLPLVDQAMLQPRRAHPRADATRGRA